MRYYSDLLKKVFDSEDACVAAEDKYLTEMEAKDAREKELREKRKERAKEVEDALKAVTEAQKKFVDLKREFIKDYGSWHVSFSTNGDISSFFDDLFSLL